ncbi:15422_t:CDS:10, partial [Racocetra persica]
IATPKTFNLHQDYGVANFNDPLSKVSQFEVLKIETYRNFKARHAAKLEIPTEQIRFWVFTQIYITPITDYYANFSMGRVYQRMGLRQNEMNLYLEIAHKPINGQTWFPPTVRNPYVMIFVKYFDPNTKYLEGLGHIYIQKPYEVDDIIPILCEKKEFPPHTPLRVYKEKNRTSMIEVTNDLKDGDIICFQKEFVEINQTGDIPTFYKSLSTRIIVQFWPKFKDEKQKPKFKLALDKDYAYDVVASHVAAYLNIDPLKLRFTSADVTFGTPRTIIKRRNYLKLRSMLPVRYRSLPTANLIYYEILDFSIVELENMMHFKVYWLGTTLKEIEAINVLLPKKAIIDDFLEDILRKLSLPGPTNKIRLFEITNCKILKEYNKLNSPIDKIPENATLYAEEIPQGEIGKKRNDKVVQVYHFTKNPSYTHGIPFKFVVKAGELFSATKLRLQARLGMDENDFAEVKFAIVQEVPHTKPKYIVHN